MATYSSTVAGTDGRIWIELTLDQVQCVGKVVKYGENGNPMLTFTCSDANCSTCEGKYCYKYTLTVYEERVSSDNLPSISDCKYGDRVKLEMSDVSDGSTAFNGREIAVIRREGDLQRSVV